MKKIVVAKALVFDNQDRLLLVRRSKTAPRRPLEWDLPGGFVDEDDESYQHACMREIAEETGVKIAHHHLRIVYAESAVDSLVGDPADITWLYFAGTSASNEVVLSYEHDQYAWVTPHEALEMIQYDRQKRALAHLLLTKN